MKDQSVQGNPAHPKTASRAASQSGAGKAKQVPEPRAREFPVSGAAEGLASIVDMLDQGIALYDANGVISYRNARYRDLFGTNVAGTAALADMQAILGLTPEAPGGSETRLMLPDGRAVMVRLSAVAGGGWLVSCTDVTAAHHTETRLKSAIDGAEVGTWEWTLANGRNLINDRWAEMLGYTRAELEPVTIDTFTRLVMAEDRAGLKKAWEDLFATNGDRFEHEFRMFHKNGHLVWVLSRGRTTAYDADGKPAVMAGVHLEVTQLKLTQDRLSQLVDGARIGTWDWDLVTDEQRGNQEWASMLGYTFEEVSPITYDRWRGLVHPDDIPAVELSMAQCVSGEKEFVRGRVPDAAQGR